MKKIFGILSFLVLTISLQAQKFQVGDLYYTITSHTAPYTVEVSKLSKKSEVRTLDIPEKVNYKGITYTVTSLGEKAFRKSKFLTSITIPNNVEIIGNSCFEQSKNLQSVNLPNSLTDIGWYAFNGCTSLATINIPSSVNSIGFGAFSECISLKTITIPNSVTDLVMTFGGCKTLESITLSDNLTRLECWTFARCTSLKSIIIPNSVTKLGWGIFNECKSLGKIIYQGTPQQWQQITKHEKWREGANFSIAYAPLPDKVQSVQQPLLAQDKSQVPVVENTPVSTVTPAPQPITQPKVMSAVDRNIPQTNLRNENTFVVIIANENYEQVASVPYANNDGKIFQQYCEKALGIPSENIKLHIDATFNHIRLSLSWLKDVCDVYNGDASVIFYYAGHGIPDVKDNSSYLLPADGDGRYVATAYKLDELYTTLGSMSAKSVVVFMDACFSGANRNGQMLASERGVALKSRPGQPKGNMVVFSAAQGDETALPNDAERHGMFTYYLLKKLQENKGNITLGELADYLVREVGRRSVVVSKLQTPCVTPSATLDASWREWKLK